ncbi:MAG: ABC transporter ATP-binding protein [Bacilli bacterium]|nr:ABC transporter ATP-binding protein [Bacilli bacterium]
MKKQKPAIIRILFDYIKNFKFGFIVALICILLNNLGAIFAPLTLQSIVNILTKWSAAGLNDGFFEDPALTLATIRQHLIVLAIAYSVSVAAGLIFSEYMAISGQKYMNLVRKRLFDHMQDLPVSYFDKNSKGDIMSIYLNDVDTIRQFISQSLPTMAMCFLTFIIVFVIMLISSIWLALIVVLGSIAMFIVSKQIGGRSAKNFIMTQNIIGKQEGYVEEMMNGLKVVKSFCHEEESQIGFDEINKTYKKAATSANSYSNILGPIMGNIGNILYVFVAFAGTMLFIFKAPNITLKEIDTITIGVIVSFLPMVKQFTGNVNQFAQQITSVAVAIGGTNRVCRLLDEEAEKDDGYVKLVRGKYDEEGNIIECDPKEATLWAWKHPHSADGSITYTLLQGDIRMFDVDFGYTEKKVILHNISLYAKPGQKVAFVGATGAGKTTITNLLNRFYDIADGKIRYDGININKITKKDLRASLGMVLQDTNLFTGTIMDNIRYGRLDATDEECIEAAKLANADSFIRRLPQGYNTYLTNDGANLSQGQRQLLSIARAEVHGAPVMILDEATSSIDTRTEALVTQGMDNLMEGKTVFVIAHRLSTIQNSNVIIVLDHGKIIERGSHEELIENKGVYYQLYTGAFELE